MSDPIYSADVNLHKDGCILPLTTRQAELFPYLEKYGGVVVGNNGREIRLPAGTYLPKFTPNRINGPSLPQANDWWKPQ